jgi:AcrR family transcriptional regulator
MVQAKTAVLASSRERLREAAKALFAERGYESTTTAEIARLAGTSQSQLIKHFTNKMGLLEAIFDYAWDQLNPAIRLATQSIASPKDKLRILLEMVVGFLVNDRQLRTLFLLEGRRIRGEAHVVVFVPGFLEFIKILDGILNEMQEQGQLDPQVNPNALRSGLMGAVEGMLRDQMLARSARFPAAYSDPDIRAIFWNFVSSCLAKPTS